MAVIRPFLGGLHTHLFGRGTFQGFTVHAGKKHRSQVVVVLITDDIKAGTDSTDNCLRNHKQHDEAHMKADPLHSREVSSL